jgi:hypothetical protein
MGKSRAKSLMSVQPILSATGGMGKLVVAWQHLRPRAWQAVRCAESPACCWFDLEQVAAWLQTSSQSMPHARQAVCVV